MLGYFKSIRKREEEGGRREEETERGKKQVNDRKQNWTYTKGRINMEIWFI